MPYKILNYLEIQGLTFRVLLVFLSGLFSLALQAQVNLINKPGYIKVPSAEWEKQPTFTFNSGFLPKENTVNRRFFYEKGIHYNFRAGITKYLEVSINFIYHLERPKSIRGIGDRQMDARLLIKRELKFWPAISVILAAPFGANYANAYNALSFTKNFNLLKSTNLQITGGYGLPYYVGKPFNKSSFGFYKKSEIQNVYLNGFFGGFSWKPVPWAGIMADYDTRDVNAGLWVGYKDRVGVQYHLYGLKNSGGNVYLKVPLGFESRELRRYRKSQKNGAY